MKLKKIVTEDGSHSFYNTELRESYHSIHGAIQESQHVFINAGFHQLGKHTDVKILEVGFGTGLNALLTILANRQAKNEIHYHALEAYPLTMKEVQDLNYTELLSEPELRPAFIRMHDCNWKQPTPIHLHFTLTKHRSKMEDFQPKQGYYNLIYFDAFAPLVQPELWSLDVFKFLYESLVKGGILVTYSAKGTVKRALKAAGFQLESLPGPIGKREMTRAVK